MDQSLCKAEQARRKIEDENENDHVNEDEEYGLDRERFNSIQ